MSADKYPSIFSRQMEVIVYIFPNFQNCACCVKDLKDTKDNSLHLGRKYVRIFVLGHYLFLVAHSFPRATLSENCSLLGTDNVRGQISEHIFAPNGGYCLYIQVCHIWKSVWTGFCDIFHSGAQIAVKVARNSFQHLNFDGSLQPLLIT